MPPLYARRQNAKRPRKNHLEKKPDRYSRNCRATPHQQMRAPRAVLAAGQRPQGRRGDALRARTCAAMTASVIRSKRLNLRGPKAFSSRSRVTGTANSTRSKVWPTVGLAAAAAAAVVSWSAVGASPRSEAAMEAMAAAGSAAMLAPPRQLRPSNRCVAAQRWQRCAASGLVPAGVCEVAVRAAAGERSEKNRNARQKNRRGPYGWKLSATSTH